MNKLYQIFLISFLGLLLSFNAQAQYYREVIEKDPDASSGLFRSYYQKGYANTPVPSGYKPFYISHYGRHGSRYHDTEVYKYAMTSLAAANEEGLLTEDGKNLLSDLEKLAEAHKGLFGQLSPRGAREHREIAERMYSRFPQVFKKRKSVNCLSSPAQRCIISMANFCTSLQSKVPDINYTFTTGEKYYWAILPVIKAPGLSESMAAMEDSMRHVAPYDKLYERLFKDPAKALTIADNPQKFIHSVWCGGAICQDLDFLNLDIYKYMDKEEIYQQSNIYNSKYYATCGGSKEWADVTIAAESDALKLFIEKADEAVKKGSNVAADLRFGHDVGLGPLMVSMGIEGFTYRYPMAEADKYWSLSEYTPMASNFQMIFYRNKKDDILVKMLFNEKETTIPALESYQGPYYKWSKVREYLLGRCSK